MIAIIGSLIFFVGAIWIAVIAFQNGDTVWGIFSIFCGIAALIYGIQHFDQAKAPTILLAIGFVVSLAGQFMEAGGQA